MPIDWLEGNAEGELIIVYRKESIASRSPAMDSF